MDLFSKAALPSKNTKYRQRQSLIRNYSEPSNLADIEDRPKECEKRNRKTSAWRKDDVIGDLNGNNSISTDVLNNNHISRTESGLIAKRIRAKVSNAQRISTKQQRLTTNQNQTRLRRYSPMTNKILSAAAEAKEKSKMGETKLTGGTLNTPSGSASALQSIPKSSETETTGYRRAEVFQKISRTSAGDIKMNPVTSYKISRQSASSRNGANSQSWTGSLTTLLGLHTSPSPVPQSSKIDNRERRLSEPSCISHDLSQGSINQGKKSQSQDDTNINTTSTSRKISSCFKMSSRKQSKASLNDKEELGGISFFTIENKKDKENVASKPFSRTGTIDFWSGPDFVAKISTTFGKTNSSGTLQSRLMAEQSNKLHLFAACYLVATLCLIMGDVSLYRQTDHRVQKFFLFYSISNFLLFISMLFLLSLKEHLKNSMDDRRGFLLFLYFVFLAGTPFPANFGFPGITLGSSVLLVSINFLYCCLCSNELKKMLWKTVRSSSAAAAAVTNA